MGPMPSNERPMEKVCFFIDVFFGVVNALVEGQQHTNKITKTGYQGMKRCVNYLLWFRWDHCLCSGHKKKKAEPWVKPSERIAGPARLLWEKVRDHTLSKEIRATALNELIELTQGHLTMVCRVALLLFYCVWFTFSLLLFQLSSCPRLHFVATRRV
jgi:hypothetical protein